jgi:hypothetical protein
MKKFVMVLFSILLVLGLNSCKKDYPDDIPEWLKKKVRKLDRQDRLHRESRREEYLMRIDEYSDGQKTIFFMVTGSLFPKPILIYDYDGNELCYISSYLGQGSCGDIEHLEDFNEVREIWHEDPTKR